jgi:hypothetical protein
LPSLIVAAKTGPGQSGPSKTGHVTKGPFFFYRARRTGSSRGPHDLATACVRARCVEPYVWANAGASGTARTARNKQRGHYQDTGQRHRHQHQQVELQLHRQRHHDESLRPRRVAVTAAGAASGGRRAYDPVAERPRGLLQHHEGRSASKGPKPRAACGPRF